jgi:tetratricopeptide (TPR) repeat protein
MTTDPHVVATLNPGLSIRQLDDAAVVSRPQTSSPAIGLPRPGSHSGMTELPASFSGPTMTTGQNQLMVRSSTEPSTVPSSGQSMQLRAQSSPSLLAAASDPNLVLSQPNIVLRRSAVGVFGWLVLAALLFGGVGALLYIALGERNAASKAASASAAAADSSGPVKVNVVLPPPEGGTERPQLGSAVAPTPAAVVPEPDAVTGSGPLVDNLRPDPARAAAPPPASRTDNRKPPPRPATIRRTQPPTDELTPKNAAALIKQARAHDKAGQWSEALPLYQRLQKVKIYAGEAYYRQAWMAFQANRLDEAIELAKESAKHTGTSKIDALILYGDVLFRQKEYERAKTIYLGVRKDVIGEPRAAMTRKIARCNEQLRLPESHGVSRD